MKPIFNNTTKNLKSLVNATLHKTTMNSTAGKVSLSSFHLNVRALGFYSETPKLENHLVQNNTQHLNKEQLRNLHLNINVHTFTSSRDSRVGTTLCSKNTAPQDILRSLDWLNLRRLTAVFFWLGGVPFQIKFFL